MTSEFDFVVLGGGSAGYAAARTASSLGLRVAVVEGGEEVGGLCILRGCMPSKTLIESANRFLTLRRAEEFGLRSPAPEFDSTAILARKKRLIGEFASHRRGQLEAGKFTFIRGRAGFVDPWTVRVQLREGGDSTLRSRSFLIATGSVINSPPVPGMDLPGILTSDHLLASAEVPASVMVLGAGPVALEAAHYYSAFGSKVTIIQRSDCLLRGTDPEISKVLRSAFTERGVEVLTSTKLLRIEKDGKLFSAVFEHNGQTREVTAEALLNALGRKPAVDGLELAHAGVPLENGAVPTSPTQQTSVSHIFAAGDVCGPHEIVHIAIQQGEIAARNAARMLLEDGAAMETIDYRLMVFAVFTEPQVGLAGRGEAELEKKGIPFLTASHPFSDHGKSMVRGEEHGFVKLIAHRETGEILGGVVVGPEGSELIHEVVVAMRFRATVHQFALIPHYHPTLSEIWLYPAEELAEQCGKGSIDPSNHQTNVQSE